MYQPVHVVKCTHIRVHIAFNLTLSYSSLLHLAPALSQPKTILKALSREQGGKLKRKNIWDTVSTLLLTIVIFRALSSGSGFIKLNGYHSESNVAKDGVELNSTHMNLSSACCSANRDLKEMFCPLRCSHWLLSKMKLSHWQPVTWTKKCTAWIVMRSCYYPWCTVWKT